MTSSDSLSFKCMFTKEQKMVVLLPEQSNLYINQILGQTWLTVLICFPKIHKLAEKNNSLASLLWLMQLLPALQAMIWEAHHSVLFSSLVPLALFSVLVLRMMERFIPLPKDSHEQKTNGNIHTHTCTSLVAVPKTPIHIHTYF